MTAPKPEPERRAPKVYITYSYESDQSMNRIRELSGRLRERGIDCAFNEYVGSPAEDWRQWLERTIADSDFVLVVCTEAYHRRFVGPEQPAKATDASFEAETIRRRLHKSWNEKPKFVPLIFEPKDQKWIPEPLRSHLFCDLSTSDGFENLVRFLTGQQTSNVSESAAGDLHQGEYSGAATFDSLEK